MAQQRQESEVSRVFREIREITRRMTPEQIDRMRRDGVGLSIRV